MHLVRYASKYSVNCVLYIETGRKHTKVMYMSVLPRVTKVPREDERYMTPISLDERYMTPISLDGTNNVERFLEIVRNRYLNSEMKTISQETADILGIEIPNEEDTDE